MKTKKRSYFLSAILVGIAMMMTGCVKEDIASIDNGGGVNPTDVNVDELNVKVTADMPTAVLSSFDENSMGAALVRRLNIKTNEVTSDTKMILIKGEDIKSRPITEWMQAAKIYLQGGYIAVEKPHNAHLVEVAEQLSTKLEQATIELMTESGHVTITPPNQQSGNAINSDAARINARVANIKSMAATRRGADDEAKPVAEMVIFSPMGYYQCDPHQGVLVSSLDTDEDGNEVVKEEIYNPDYTKRSSGCLADGAAMWLNTKNAQTPTNKATNRADGGGAINELMSASEEHYYQRHLTAKDWNGQARHKSNGFTETIRVWGSHNMKTNKDYYFVEQKALSAVGGQQEGDARLDPNKTLYAGPYKEDEWIDANFDAGHHYTRYYGAFWQWGIYTLNLVGSGTIKLEDALPTTDNNTTSTSIAVGETHSETSTVGVSMGMVGFQPSVGLNYSHGWTNGTSYTMTTTTNTKEIAVQKNTEANKVTWKYVNGQKTYDDTDYDKHALASAAVTTDVNMDNQACWSVEKPEGEYTLEVTSNSYLRSIYLQPDWKKWQELSPSQEDNKYKLIVPNRAEQTWHMDVTFPEIGQEGHEGQKGLLTQYLEKQFPDLYQTKLSLADKTAESENTIKILVNQADYLLHNSDGGQTLREYALDLGISQYTIKWFTTDDKHSVYTVDVKAKE